MFVHSNGRSVQPIRRALAHLMIGCAISAISISPIALNAAKAADFEWSNTYVSLDQLYHGSNPGDTGFDNRTELNIDHSDGWTYGSNFVAIDLKKHTNDDETNNALGSSSGVGSGEFYGLFRTVLSGDKISGNNSFSFGPIKDVGLEIGGDYGIHNDSFSSLKRMIVIGPQFAFDIPNGYWNVSVHFSQEWNTNAFLPNGGSIDYSPAIEYETAWDVPFSLGPIPLHFTGYMNVIGPKGAGNPQASKTRTEILANPKLLVDVGQLTGGQPGKFDVGIGYQYWRNIFGTYNGAPGVPGGAEQHAPFLELGYNFN